MSFFAENRPDTSNQTNPLDFPLEQPALPLEESLIGALISGNPRDGSGAMSDDKEDACSSNRPVPGQCSSDLSGGAGHGLRLWFIPLCWGQGLDVGLVLVQLKRTMAGE